MYYYSGLRAVRRMNQQLAIKRNAAGNGIPRNNSLRRISSDSSLYFGSITSQLNHYDDDHHDWDPIVYNFISTPSTPTRPSDDDDQNHYYSSSSFTTTDTTTSKSSNSNSKASSEEDSVVPEGPAARPKVGRVGLLTTVMFSRDPKVSGTKPAIVPFPEKVQPPGSDIDDQLAATSSSAAKYIPIQFGSRELIPLGGANYTLRIRQDWPCIFAPDVEPTPPLPIKYSELILKPNSVCLSDCRGHAIINPAEVGVCFRPLTHCSVHKNAGHLRLEDIERSESYTRVEVTLPIPKVTHRFNSCVLEFPLTDDPIVFNKDKDVRDPPQPGPGAIYPDKSCANCGKSLAGRDMYLYRNLVYCGDDCRFDNTLEAFLQRMVDPDLAAGGDHDQTSAQVGDDHHHDDENSQEERSSTTTSTSTPSSSSSTNEDKDDKGKGKGKGILYIC